MHTLHCCAPTVCNAAYTLLVSRTQAADFGLSKVTLSGVARVDGWEGQAHCLAPECLDSEARLASDVVSRDH